MIYLDLEYALAFAFSRGSISNTEFALHRESCNEWLAEAGNPNRAVRLGETSGDVKASGTTAEEAVLNMIKALEAAPKLAGKVWQSVECQCEQCLAYPHIVSRVARFKLVDLPPDNAGGQK